MGSPVLDATGSRDSGPALTWVWKMLLLWSIGPPASRAEPWGDSHPCPLPPNPSARPPSRGSRGTIDRLPSVLSELLEEPF